MVLLKYIHGPVLLILHNIIYHFLEFALNKKGRQHPKKTISEQLKMHFGSMETLLNMEIERPYLL